MLHPGDPVDEELTGSTTTTIYGSSTLGLVAQQGSLPALVVWGWRWLTTMRTAVILLSLLGLAAIPGSLLPQRNVASDPGAVQGFYRDNPTIAPWLDRLGLFDVYASAWFAGIYILLLVSMTGCVLPRCLTLWRESRADPPAAPRTLVGPRGGRELLVEADREAALDAARTVLRQRHRQVKILGGEVRAERGQVREIGNLLFHLSLLVLLLGIALGKLQGFEGRVAIIEGQSFANTVSQYDEFSPSALTDIDGLEQLSLTLDEFDASFSGEAASRGEPRSFEATLDWSTPEGQEGRKVVRPNAPLDINETKFFLTGHGYAPEITVTDGRGDVVFSGPTIFYPIDSSYASDGVVKVPDARPEQLALQGLFLPTAAQEDGQPPVSVFPAPVNPRLLLTAWSGDLGLDTGETQNVFTLDTSNLTEVGGGQDRTMLAPGQTMQLGNGLGSIRFDGVRRFANFQIAYDPGKEIALAAAIMLLLGLTISLTVRRWRVWARVTLHPEVSSGLVSIEIGGLALSKRRSDEQAMRDEIERVASTLETSLDVRQTQPTPQGAAT